MFGQFDIRSEDKAIRRNAALACLPPEILFRDIVCAEQPEYRAIDLGEQPHPDVENRRGDFEAVVEAAKDESVWRKAQLCPRVYLCCDLSIAVGGLITVGKINHLLGVVLLLVFGNDDPVGYDVVDICRTRG